MTDTGALMQAKAEAVNALAAALTNAMNAGQIGNLSAVLHFLNAWTAGVNAMVPATEAALDPAAQPVIGTVLIDRDNDAWRRMADGRWTSFDTAEEARYSTYSMGSHDWSKIQQYGPFRKA